MKRTLFVILGLIFTQFVLADQADTTKLVKLATTIKALAATADVSADNVKQAESKLLEVIELLTDEDADTGVSSDFTTCYDFVFPKYNMVLSSATAADRATAGCRVVADIEVTKFLFSKYNMVMSSSDAMDRAVAGSVKQLKGKTEIITFLFSKYNTTLSSSDAASKSVEGAKKVSRKGGVACIQKLFSNYNMTMSSADAMDRSIAGCAQH